MENLKRSRRTFAGFGLALVAGVAALAVAPAAVQAAYPEKPLYVSTVGPHTLDNYAVHQLEVIEALMGPGIRRLKAFAPGEAVTQLILDYGDGRMAGFNQTPQPWAEFNFMVTGSGRGTDGARWRR